MHVVDSFLAPYTWHTVRRASFVRRSENMQQSIAVMQAAVLSAKT